MDSTSLLTFNWTIFNTLTTTQANQVITVYYYYDSSQLSPSFDESHNVIDVGTTLRPTDLWSIDLDMSQSAINSQTNQRIETESFVSDARPTPLYTQYKWIDYSA